MYALIGDSEQAREKIILAINESPSLSDQIDFFMELIDLTKKRKSKSGVYGEFDAFKSQFCQNEEYEFKFLTKLVEVKEDYEDEVTDEVARLTELEDYEPGTVANNGDCVEDDDIVRQIEDITIPKKEKPLNYTGDQWWKKRNKKGETILQEKIIELKLHGETEAKMKEIGDLIDRGHPVNIADNAGYTPLHEAANLGLPITAELLLKKGANIDAKTDPNTCFHHNLFEKLFVDIFC